MGNLINQTKRHRDTETQRHRDTETQRHRDTETETDRERDRQRQTETDRDRQRQTKTGGDWQTQTETARDRQRQAETDRDRQRQTDTDRHRQTRSADKPKINKNAQFHLLFQHQKLRLQRFSQTLWDFCPSQQVILFSRSSILQLHENGLHEVLWQMRKQGQPVFKHLISEDD